MEDNNMKYWENKSLDTLEGETWRSVVGYEGIYNVSNLGRIKSLKRVVLHKRSKTKTISEGILTIRPDTQGYLITSLWKENICFHALVHREVAKAFIPNASNLPEVNHKWGDKEDNRVSELNWMTPSQNQKHSYDVLKRDRGIGKTGSEHSCSKKVRCTTLGIEFDSFRVAAKELGVCEAAISFVCTGIRKHTQGLVFKCI